MSKLSYTYSTVTKSWSRFSRLLADHAAEIYLLDNKGSIPYDLDLEMYGVLENANLAFCVIAEDENKEPVGYMSVVIMRELHYKTKIYATIDSFYLDKKHREGFKSVTYLKTMVQMIEDKLKKEYNIDWIYFSFSERKNVELIARKFGYELEYHNYRKLLK